MPHPYPRFSLGTFTAALWLCAAAAAVPSDGTHSAAGRGAAVEAAPTAPVGGSLWLVSTRRLEPCSGEAGAGFEPDVWRHDADEGWQETTIADFYAQDGSDSITLVYIHGNRFEWHDAIEFGFMARSALQLDSATGPAVRFVIWSWPSAPIKGLLRDARAKAERSQLESVLLARFLTDLDPASRVSLLGSSYGARIITGALHVLAGGTLNGYPIPPGPAPPAVRAVVTAPALDNDWLLPGGYHGLAMSQIDAVLVLYNSLDPALKRYDCLVKCSRDEALGRTGLAASPLACDWGDRYTEQDVSRWLGHVHSESNYFRCPCLMRESRRYLLWEPLD